MGHVKWSSRVVGALLPLAIVGATVQSRADQISGQAKAIDATTIEIGNKRVMLFGTDSVMRKQLCALDGKPWKCWEPVVKELQSLLDQGPVICETVGDPDVFGRILGRCTVNNQSINEQLVAHGYAVARTSESKDYVAAEAAAKQQKLGLWQGQFMLPSDFRRSAGILVDRP